MVKIINHVLKLNLSRIQIIDAAYMVFYYGIDKRWKEFSQTLFSRYDRQLLRTIFNLVEAYRHNGHRSMDLGKTNQTVLSAYFRNMYNAIMLIHENNDLNRKQKKQYIKILRAQLSNPELVILYFNVMSRFGKRWEENKLIMEYEFLKNLPLNACKKDYNPKDDFPLEYEEEELAE